MAIPNRDELKEWEEETKEEEEEEGGEEEKSSLFLKDDTENADDKIWPLLLKC